MADNTPDMFAPHKCAFCGKHGAAFRVEMNPPDESTEVFKFFCASGCLANYGTNQPRPNA